MINYRLPGASPTDALLKPKPSIEAEENHVFFYNEVDSDNALNLLREIRTLDRQLRTEQISRGTEGAPLPPIWLHIHSIGGDLFTGFRVADQLSLIKAPVYSIVEGVCASAATLIALACQKRYILPNGFMLIHQLSSMMWGTHEQFKDEMMLQKLAMDGLVRFYSNKAGVSEEKIRRMLKRDTWMDAETAIQLGFADEVLRA